MARNMYQYETSPRKLEPEYVPTRKKQVKKKVQTKTNKSRSTVQKNKNVVVNRNQKVKNVKHVLIVMGVFAVLFAISYRNSLINEQFTEVKNLKNQLAVAKKENSQLNKEIEESLNKENIEKVAQEELGMQKQTEEQTIEITIEKSDYIETPIEETTDTEEEKSVIEKIIDFFN